MVERLSIDSEFEAEIPTLSDEEKERLEASILEHGCRDAIVLWNGTIIDGHHRYTICQDHDIPFHTVDYTDRLKTREDVLNWIDMNQLGRRNMSPAGMADIRGKMYRRMKKDRHSRPENQNAAKPGGQIVHPVSCEDKTAEKVATMTGVNEKTVRRDAVVSESLDAVTELTEDPAAARRALVSPSVKLSKKEAVELGKLAKTAPETVKRVVDAVVSGEAETVGEAMDAHVMDLDGADEEPAPEESPDVQSDYDYPTMKRHIPKINQNLAYALNQLLELIKLEVKHKWSGTDRDAVMDRINKIKSLAEGGQK